MRGPAAHATLAGQRAALSLMVDTCTITRRAVEPVRVGGRDTWPAQEVYRGPCRVQTHEAYAATPEAAGHTYVVATYRVDLPAGTGPFTAGDVITVAGYPHPFRVTAEMGKTYMTAQRLVCQTVET